MDLLYILIVILHLLNTFYLIIQLLTIYKLNLNNLCIDNFIFYNQVSSNSDTAEEFNPAPNYFLKNYLYLPTFINNCKKYF